MTAHSKGPTLEELHAVWLRRTQRSGRWPPTFEEAMADPLLSRILKIRALHVDLQRIMQREVTPPEYGVSSPVTMATGMRHREPDRAAYWMDSKDPEDKEG